MTQTGYRLFVCAVLPLGITLARAASAQAPAAENAAPQSREVWVQTGLRVGGGLAFTPGLSTGFYGQAELNYIGPGVGMALVGLDGWKAKEGWGLGVPSGVYIWYPISVGYGDSPALFTSLKAGWSWVTFDRVNEENQFGIFAPAASASFGVVTRRWRLHLDGQAEYRWHFTGENRAQYRAGLSFAVNFET